MAAASWRLSSLLAPGVTRSCACGGLLAGLVADANTVRLLIGKGKGTGAAAWRRRRWDGGAQLATTSWWCTTLLTPRVTRTRTCGCLCLRLVANARQMSAGKREGGGATTTWPITTDTHSIAAEPNLGEVVARPTAQALVRQGGVHHARRAIQALRADICGVIAMARFRTDCCARRWWRSCGSPHYRKQRPRCLWHWHCLRRAQQAGFVAARERLNQQFQARGNQSSASTRSRGSIPYRLVARHHPRSPHERVIVCRRLGLWPRRPVDRHLSRPQYYLRGAVGDAVQLEDLRLVDKPEPRLITPTLRCHRFEDVWPPL